MRIRQAELERLKRLIQQKDQLEDEYQALRLDLIEQHRAGAAVEPGRWKLRIKETFARRFSREGLISVLGPPEAERIRRLLPPTRTMNVRVSESQRRRAR